MIKVALVIGILLLTVTVNDANADTIPTVSLIGSRSGYSKARNSEHRQAITVAPLPSFHTDAALQRVLDEWNTAAGWAMFVAVGDERLADISFRTDADTYCPDIAGACVEWLQHSTGWYAHCWIVLYTWPTSESTLMHELGHCLGFQDVVNPVEGGYRGIMSYGRDWDLTPNNPQDVASLELANYR